MVGNWRIADVGLIFSIFWFAWFFIWHLLIGCQQSQSLWFNGFLNPLMYYVVQNIIYLNLICANQAVDFQHLWIKDVNKFFLFFSTQRILRLIIEYLWILKEIVNCALNSVKYIPINFIRQNLKNGYFSRAVVCDWLLLWLPITWNNHIHNRIASHIHLILLFLKFCAVSRFITIRNNLQIACILQVFDINSQIIPSILAIISNFFIKIVLVVIISYLARLKHFLYFFNSLD